MNDLPRILAIDDNDNSLDLLELYLYKEYELITARNGFEGLNLAEKELPRLIISDIMMPQMDGIRFFNELKKRPAIAAIPVIAVTSFIEQITVKSLTNIGFVTVMSKPLKRDVILETIARILEKKEPDLPPATD